MNIGESLKNLLLDLTIGRAKVATVDKWDGSASNYDSTEAYCKACLIDVNPTGEKKKQSHCMLPVRKPGSMQMADKAIFAVAGGRGIGAVKKPADVDQATWDKAVKKAATQIEGAYYSMNKPVPNTIKDMVGVSRSVSVDSLYQQLQNCMYDDMGMYGSMAKEYGYLSTVYIDNGDLYALFVKEGLYSRAKLTIDPATDVVTLGPLEDVTQTFTPVQRSTVSITRDASGAIRLFVLAGTALINRVNQIDSTTLYDDMIKRAADYNYYPTFDLHHLGQYSEQFEFGRVDWLGRDGVCYLASGTLDPDHWLTEPITRAIESEPDQWGASIEYYPLLESIEFITVDDLEIPVFKQGLNMRISILPETSAAAWFTNVSRENKPMTREQEDTLKKLLGEKEYTKRMAAVADVNGAVDKHKLVFRSTDQPADQASDPVVTPAATPETTPTATATAIETAPTSSGLLEVDDGLLNELANKVTTAQAYTAPFDAITSGLNTLEQALANLTGVVQTLQNGVTSSVNRMNQRLDQIEQADQEQSRVLKVDAPRKATDPKLRMVYRPSVVNGAVSRQLETEVEPSYADIAQKTLDERYPKVGI